MKTTPYREANEFHRAGTLTQDPHLLASPISHTSRLCMVTLLFEWVLLQYYIFHSSLATATSPGEIRCWPGFHKPNPLALFEE